MMAAVQNATASPQKCNLYEEIGEGNGHPQYSSRRIQTEEPVAAVLGVCRVGHDLAAQARQKNGCVAQAAVLTVSLSATQR